MQQTALHIGVAERDEVSVSCVSTTPPASRPWPLWVSGPWAAVLIARMLRGGPAVRRVVGRPELTGWEHRRHHHC